jgi:hypothetical protein
MFLSCHFLKRMLVTNIRIVDPMSEMGAQAFAMYGVIIPPFENDEQVRE